MSYDPTERAPETPYQQPTQPSLTPPTYGQVPQPPASSPQEPVAPTQYTAQPPSYGQLPQSEQSNLPLPLYGPPQPTAYEQSGPTQPPSGVPIEHYGQPQQPSWSAAVPPGYPSPGASSKQSRASLWVIFLVAVLILVIIVGAGGYVIYRNTRPQPVITLTSHYTDGTTLVGAASTSFTLYGTDFTSNSAITFLLDGKPLSGAPSLRSDSNGKLSATNLPVTSEWAVGRHILTAKDASGYRTKVGVKVEIVTPGQTNTPGPAGAPTDSANISIVALVIADSSSGMFSLIVTGSANGGAVCRDIDDGEPYTQTGIANDVPFTETTVSTCSGTYKDGQLDYTETVTTDKIVYANGLICSTTAPYVGAHLQGTFTSDTTIHGDYTDDAFTRSCNVGVGSQSLPATTGYWTGIAVTH